MPQVLPPAVEAINQHAVRWMQGISAHGPEDCFRDVLILHARMFPGQAATVQTLRRCLIWYCGRTAAIQIERQMMEVG